MGGFFKLSQYCILWSSPVADTAPFGFLLCSHRIFSSDRDFTLWPEAGTELTLDLGKSSVTLPVVGGWRTMDEAGLR